VICILKVPRLNCVFKQRIASGRKPLYGQAPAHSNGPNPRIDFISRFWTATSTESPRC